MSPVKPEGAKLGSATELAELSTAESGFVGFLTAADGIIQYRFSVIGGETNILNCSRLAPATLLASATQNHKLGSYSCDT